MKRLVRAGLWTALILGLLVCTFASIATKNVAAIAGRNIVTSQWLGEWYTISFHTPQAAFHQIEWLQGLILVGLVVTLVAIVGLVKTK